MGVSSTHKKGTPRHSKSWLSGMQSPTRWKVDRNAKDENIFAATAWLSLLSL